MMIKFTKVIQKNKPEMKDGKLYKCCAELLVESKNASGLSLPKSSKNFEVKIGLTL